MTMGPGFRVGGGAAGLGLAAVLVRNVAKYKRATSERFELLESPQPGTPEFADLVEAMTGATQRPGNRVTIMRNGETLDEMVEAISGATRTVDLSSYIYWPGTIADRFSAALAERARAGVEVNLILDGYGSAKLGRQERERLRQAGVHVAVYRPPRWHTLHKANNRMHRRILLVDGAVGFAGGVGIADVWTGDAQDAEHWRETHLRIEGPVLRDLYGAFLENWSEASAQVLTRDHIPGGGGFEDGVEVVASRSTPNGWATATTLIFSAAIAGARERLWLTTAYFVPDRASEDLLCASARRGVDVRLLINGQRVDKVARQAGRRSYAKLLDAGVRIFEYNQTMLHAKVMLVDDGWANVGSGNFDNRSLDLDLELNVAVADPDCVAELEGHFLEDLAVSEEIDPQAWRNRPWRTRLKEGATEMVRQSL
jgi:cardiolipin synthase A/B